MGPLLPPEKIAPKIKIKITGKIRAKKKPVLFRKYSLRKTFRSASIRFGLTKEFSLSWGLLRDNLALVLDGGADEFYENVFERVANHDLPLPGAVGVDQFFGSSGGDDLSLVHYGDLV